MEITAIVAVCKIAIDGAKIYAAIRAQALSDRETELLVHASRDGDFCYLHTAVHGHWVRAGTKDFFDQGDRAHQAYYVDAFCSLCQRGLIRHEGGHLFRLTGVGFAKARDLATENPFRTEGD